ncbi:MAG: hypothetical protein ABIO04_09115, partial [Ferruginibacter sp.]
MKISTRISSLASSLECQSTMSKNSISRKSVIAFMLRGMAVLLTLVASFNNVFAQPTSMSINQDVSGTYANTVMNLQGGAFRARFQEDGTGTASGTRNWQFNADGYFNTWGVLSTNPASSVTIAAYNATIAPNINTASANWEAGAGYNNKGRLLATQANYYYTYNIIQGSSYASQKMAVLETSYNPVTVNTVTQGAGAYGGSLVTITMSGTPNAATNTFVRYSTNSFATSTIIQATGAGAVLTATIPYQTSAVSYYVYTSNKSKTTIDAEVSIFNSQEIHDLSTLNLNNNGGANYSFTPVAGNIIVTSSGGSAAGVATAYSTFTTATTGLFAILNGGTVHTGNVTALIT